MVFNHPSKSYVAALIDKEKGELDKEEYLNNMKMKEVTPEVY
jgi:hypothetical protein